MKTLLSKLSKTFFYLVKRPFVYLSAFVFALMDVLQGEQSLAIIDDSVQTDVCLIGTETEPVLMFKATYVGTHLFAGFEIDSEHREQGLRQHWRRYLEQREPQEVNDVAIHKPDFVRTFQFIIHRRFVSADIVDLSPIQISLR